MPTSSADLVSPATVIHLRGRPVVSAIDATAWVGLDPATGVPIGDPIELGTEPLRPVQYDDLDGDGEPDALVLGPSQVVADELTLTAVSLSGGGPLWTLDIHPPRIRGIFVTSARQALGPGSEWPAVVDLDGDRRPEVILPIDSSSEPVPNRRGIRVLDGTSGRDRWQRSLTLYRQPIQSFDAGPDLDGDGAREVFVASLDAGRHEDSFLVGQEKPVLRVFVDALSGRDGHPLWPWRQAIERAPGDSTPMSLDRLRWWSPGPDGRPRLVVPIGVDRRFGTAAGTVVHVLEAATGRLLQSISGLEGPRVDDLDGDGLADLWARIAGLPRLRRRAPRCLAGPRPLGAGQGLRRRRHPRRRHRRADRDARRRSAQAPRPARPVGRRRPPALADAARCGGRS